MTLTVTEKEHWKSRFARKIAQAIDLLVEREDPGYFERVRSDAREEAIRSLGIANLLEREAQLDQQEKQLRQERTEVHNRITAIVKKQPVPDYPSGFCHSGIWEAAIRKRQDVVEQRLMAESELGRKILRLRREEDELLDTVWLATSPKQIKSLWQGVAELLSAEPTPLQRQAMIASEPTDDA